jgi:hypothetical protein
MLAAPDDTMTRYALAVAQAHCGDVDSALPQFIRTVGDAEAHYNLAIVLQDEGLLDEAERHFSIALAKKPELTAARDWLAHLQSIRNSEESVVQAVAMPTSSPPGQVLPANHSSVSPSAPQPAAGRDAAAPPPPRHLTPRQLEQLHNQVSGTVR